MKLKEFLHLMRRNVVLLILASVFGGIGGFGISVLMPTTYSSRTEMFVSVSTSGEPYEMQMASSFIQERIQTYVDMTGSRPVLEPVIDRLDLDMTPEELASQISAYSDPRTVLITVEARADTARDAAEISRAVADSLVTVIGDVESPSAEATGQIQLKVSNPAVPPTRPEGLALWTCIGLGLPVGLAIGLGLALLRANLDSRLRSKEDVEAITSASVLASIPDDPRIVEQPLITEMVLDNPRGEAFRRLRTNLGFAQVDDTNSAILITSAQAQEGKSSTSINLAIALAQAGSRVALVDVDLRQPTVAQKLGLENSAGLTTALLGSADVSDLLQPWGQDELCILTAGMMPPNPAELLDSRAMGTLITRLTGEFDIVILDGPPLLPVADSLVLSKHVGRVLLVASVGQVRIGDLQEALRSLDALKAQVNLVLNRVPRSSTEMNGYYQPYSSRSQELRPRTGRENGTDRSDGLMPDAAGERSNADDRRYGEVPPSGKAPVPSGEVIGGAETGSCEEADAGEELVYSRRAASEVLEAHIWPGRFGRSAGLTRRESLSQGRRLP